MTLIERYILRRIVIIGMAALTITTLIALTTQVLIRIDVLTSSGQSMLVILNLAALLIPSMVVVVIPFALMIGIIQTLRAMNQDSELVVLESSGGSMVRKYRPVMTAAVGASLITFFLAVFVEPASDRQLRELLARAAGDLISTAVQSGTFTRIEDGLYIQIAERLAGGTFGQIYISDTRDDATALTYYAKRGQILTDGARNLLIVEDGEIHSKNNANDTLSVITFDRYAIDVASFTSGIASRSLSPKERTTSYLFNPDVADPLFQAIPYAFKEELHRRLSAFLYPLAMAVLSLYFVGAAQSNRQEAGASVTLAAGGSIGLRGIGFYLTSLAGKSTFATVLVYAYPILVTILFSALILLGMLIKNPSLWIEQAQLKFRWLQFGRDKQVAP